VAGFEQYKVSFNIEGYEEFVKNFIKKFWYYLKGLDLYILKDLFQILGKYLKVKDLPLRWNVLKVNEITVDYRKRAIKKCDIKNSSLLKDRYTYHVSTETVEKNYRKIIRSSQANFIHSLDAFINLYVLSQFKKDIYSIHDAWAIPMGESLVLLDLVRTGYSILSEQALEQCLINFKIELKNSVGDKAVEAFSKYCEEKLKKGTLDLNKLKLSKFICYYG